MGQTTRVAFFKKDVIIFLSPTWRHEDKNTQDRKCTLAWRDTQYNI
jgi:hypothetical protein